MDRNFRCASCASDRVVFQLEADERTRQSYPFDFALTVGYAVQGDTLAVSYKVENRGSIPMPFCLGCHTAYNWPLLPGDDPQDYSLRFEKEEELESFNPFGWRQPFVQGRERPLSHALFTNYTRSVYGPALYLARVWQPQTWTARAHPARIVFLSCHVDAA